MFLDTTASRGQDRAAPSTESDHEEGTMPIRLLVTVLAVTLALASPALAQEMCPETYGAESYPLDDYGFVTVDPGSIATMDVSGDSISKAFNGKGSFPCPNHDQEQYNWATSDTNGLNFCTAGPDGVYSQAERIECLRGAVINRAVPNHAESGAQMLLDFVNQAGAIHQYLSSQPAPRYVPVLLGHNDVCAGKVPKFLPGCEHGSDQDPNNHCRTRPDAFERELRKGLDILITIPETRIGVAAMVRVSELCNHGNKQNCQAFLKCSKVWKAAAYTGWIFGADNGICGSLTLDCSPQRLIDTYLTARAYRDVAERVTGEYAAIPPGGTSPVVTIAGQTVGGATKADGVVVAYSDAAWRVRFPAALLNCCDCFHPSPLGQTVGAATLLQGLTCTAQTPCCRDTGDTLDEALCTTAETSGTFYPGFFN
jgi:hypothetical protein